MPVHGDFDLSTIPKPPLNILLPTRYPSVFNSPRRSRHNTVRRNFVPFNYISNKIEGFTVFRKKFGERFDLVHAFNRIPVGRTPYVIGFESHLPRAFGVEDSFLFRRMTESLASERCKGIVAISNYAANLFRMQHIDSPYRDILEKKLEVQFPAVSLGNAKPVDFADNSKIKLLFVGNHFARKGGCVALRIAEAAIANNLPIEVEIVSNFEIGSVSWTDPLDPNFFDQYKPLLSLPNVKVYSNVPNVEVIKKIREASFLLLTTFGDTFGYSAIEAMMNGLPVIATRQCALPEFIIDKNNGILIDIELNEKMEWVHLNKDYRSSLEFSTIHSNEVRRIASEVLHRLLEIKQEKGHYSKMRLNAFETIKTQFNSIDRDMFWDNTYANAV